MCCCREKKDWYDSALTLVRKMTQMSARLDRDNNKLYVDIMVPNLMTRESFPYTIGVDLCANTGAIKVSPFPRFSRHVRLYAGYRPPHTHTRLSLVFSTPPQVRQSMVTILC